MKRVLILAIFVMSFMSVWAQRTENVILITFDGLRWQELFSGAEKRIITKEFAGDSARIMQAFWNDDPLKRRELLFPFFWSTIAKEGQIYGNRAYGNYVNVTNQQWFSYPGYSEILCGFADDARIHSNDKINNPNTNVLEFIQQQPSYKGKVAAFTSWDVFPYIINSQRSGVPVNSGIVKKEKPNEREKLINELMYLVPNPLGDIRLDAFTFHYAFEYLKTNKPRVLYIGFDETDDFAHGGKYDLYLHSARNTDKMIEQLWNWCQQDPQYKGKTTFIFTTDHGRGDVNISDWRHHGIKMPHADEIWMAFLGPDTPALGEVKTKGQLYQSQVAQTLAAFLELDYKSNQPVGDIVKSAKK